jgi:hypothetical protein
MASIERAHFLIPCPCGAKGLAYWQENDGARFLRRGPEMKVEIVGPFDWVRAASTDVNLFFGRRLICRECGRQPSPIEVRPVA